MRKNGEKIGEYTGGFKDNLPHGFGTFKWSQTNEKYTGNFWEGKRHTNPDDPDAVQVYNDHNGDSVTWRGRFDMGQRTIPSSINGVAIPKQKEQDPKRNIPV